MARTNLSKPSGPTGGAGGVQDATRGIKQSFCLEQFLVGTWRAIRRLLGLVAWAFFWLNEWGQAGYSSLLGG
jgi:hypothetical protein